MREDEQAFGLTILVYIIAALSAKVLALWALFHFTERYWRKH